MKNLGYIIITLLFFSLSLPGQNRIDSLLSLAKNNSADTNKVNVLNELAMEFRNNDPDTSIYFAKQALALAEKLKYDKGRGEAYLWLGTSVTNLHAFEEALNYLNNAVKIFRTSAITKTPEGKQLLARTLNNRGIVFRKQGNLIEAFASYEDALSIRLQTGDKKSIADSYNNLGVVMEKQGNYPEALKYYLKSLEIREQIQDDYGVAMSYHNVAMINHAQKDLAAALKNYSASIALNKKLNDSKGLMVSYNGMGSVYDDMLEYDAALKNYLASLAFAKEIGDELGEANAYTNMAAVYVNQGKFEEGIRDHLLAYKLHEKLQNADGLSSASGNLGFTLIHLKRLKEAKQWMIKSYKFAVEGDSKQHFEYAYLGLARVDSALGNWESSFENYILYIKYRDSLVNEENTKKIVQSQMQYEFSKKDLALKAEQDKKDALSAEELKQQKLQRNYFIVGFVLVLFLAGFILVNFLQKRKANRLLEEKNNLIEKQKHEVEEKQKELLDSIYYARKIQRALITNEKYIERNLRKLMSK